MLRFSKSLLVAAVVAGTTGAAVADTWDNPNVAAPIVNNSIALDGDFADWGAPGQYTQFGDWHQWYDGNYDYPGRAVGDSPSTTTSRLAIDTNTDRLIIGIRTNELGAMFELHGLFGGTTSLEGVRSDHLGGRPGTGTQLWWNMPLDPETGSNVPLTIGGHEVLANGGVYAPAANTDGVSGAYSFDGEYFTIEVAVPVKFDWTADATDANTYDLEDLAGLVGDTGDNNLNVAYNVSFYYGSQPGGDAQAARLDGLSGLYGDTHQPDYWYHRAVNSLGVGPNSDPNNNYISAAYGGLTLVGTPLPEPGSLALLAAGGVLMLKRRRLA